MKGSYRIVVQNAKVRYDFEVRRNITIIKGNSATGKTTLVEMIKEYYENGIESGIILSCDRECAVLAGRDWEASLVNKKECILFIDEGNRFVHSKEFARAVQENDNYYVIITRESLESLPYSVEEVYGIRESGKYATIKQVYHELYHLYGKELKQEKVIPSKIIVEDSNAGFEFFDAVSQNKNYSVISANGKSNIFEKIMENMREESLVIIADGSAFGSEIDRIMKIVDEKKHIFLYLPESFEWLILKSGILEDREIREVLNMPQDFIDSSLYMSWERFFTAFLVRKTDHTYLQYTKRKLNPVYLQKQERELICMQMENIRL